MDRRKALKGLGLSLGYFAATPAVFSLLQSCRNDDVKEIKINWAPQFFSKGDAQILETLVGMILPKTKQYPGAKELNIHQFIDSYLRVVAGEDQQKYTREGFAAISIALQRLKNNFGEEEYKLLLTQYLLATPEKLEEYKYDENESLILDTLRGLRKLTVWAYKTSEHIGKELLPYDPIPGQYKGCIPLSEATDGKAWAL